MQHLPAEESLPGLRRALRLRLAGAEPQPHAAAIPPAGVLSGVKDLGESTSAEQELGEEGKLSAGNISPKYPTDRQTAKSADSRQGGGMLDDCLLC